MPRYGPTVANALLVQDLRLATPMAHTSPPLPGLAPRVGLRESGIEVRAHDELAI